MSSYIVHLHDQGPLCFLKKIISQVQGHGSSAADDDLKLGLKTGNGHSGPGTGRVIESTNTSSADAVYNPSETSILQHQDPPAIASLVHKGDGWSRRLNSSKANLQSNLSTRILLQLLLILSFCGLVSSEECMQDENNGGEWKCGKEGNNDIWQLVPCTYCQHKQDDVYCKQNHASCSSQSLIDCTVGYSVKSITPVNDFHDPADTGVQVAGTYADYIDDTNPYPSECAMSCKIQSSDSSPYVLNSNGFGTYSLSDQALWHSSSMELRYYKSSPFYMSVDMQCTNHFKKLSWTVPINVQCQAAHTVVSIPTMTDGLTQSSTITYPSEKRHQFWMNPFTTNTDACRMTYTAYADTAATQAIGTINMEEPQFYQGNNNNWFRIKIQDTSALKKSKATYVFYIKVDSMGGHSFFDPNTPFTLNVVCGSTSCNTAIDDTGVTNPSTFNVDAASKNMVLGEPTCQYATDCATFTNQITSDQSGTLYSSHFSNASAVIRNTIQGLGSRLVAECQHAQKGSYTFYLKATAEGGETLYSPYQIDLVCHSGLSIDEDPSFPSTQLLYYDPSTANLLTFIIPAFTNQWGCILTMQVDDDTDTTTIAHSKVQMASPTSTTVQVSNEPAEHTVYIFVTMEGGATLYSSPIIVSVSCDPSSTSVVPVVTITQEVGPNSPYTRFELPIYTISPSLCQITNVYTSSKNNEVMISPLEAEGTIDAANSMLYFTPSDITIEQDITFYIHPVVFKGVQLFHLNKFHLKVGCGTYVSITYNASFTLSQVWGLGDPSDKYTIQGVETSVASCPIVEYVIIDETDPALQGGFVYPPSDGSCDGLAVCNLIQLNSALAMNKSITILAKAAPNLAGDKQTTLLSSPVAFSFICGVHSQILSDNALTVTYASEYPQGIAVSQIGSLDLLLNQANDLQSITFQGFGLSNPLNCVMKSYELREAATVTNIYSALAQPVMHANFSFTLQVPTDNLATFNFKIFGDAEGGAYKIGEEVAIRVKCGSETVSRAITYTYGVLNLEDESSSEAIWFQYLSQYMAQQFSSDKALCPIQEYKIFSDSALTNDITSGDGVAELQYATFNYAKLNVRRTTPMTFSIYLQAISKGLVTNHYQVEFFVCGQETLVLNGSEPIQIGLPRADTSLTIEFQELHSLFVYSTGLSHVTCNTSDFNLYTDPNGTVPWVNDNQIQLIQDPLLPTPQKKLVIAQNDSFIEKTLYLRRVTRGQVAVSQEVRIEVCGYEKVEFTSTNQSLHYEFEVNSGQASQQQIQTSDLNFLFSVNSTQCKITTYQLYELIGGEYKVLQSQLVGVFSNTYLYFKTWRDYKLDVYLGIQTDLSQPLFMPVSIRIVDNVLNAGLLSLLNHEPTLETEPSSLTLIAASQTTFPLFETHAIDDKQVAALRVESKTFGDMDLLYQESLTATSAKTSSKYLTYSKNQGQVYLNFESTAQMTSFVGTKDTVVLTLTDNEGLEKEYEFEISIMELPTFNPEQNEEELKVEEEEFKDETEDLTAKIESATQYGDLVIQFSTNMRTKEVKLADINTETLDIYIKTYDNWLAYEENFNLTLLNFTWEATSFERDTLSLKLNFFSVESISPQIYQDQIVVHFKDPMMFYSATLFKPLDESSWTIQKRLRKQVKDEVITHIMTQGSSNLKEIMNSSLVMSFVMNIFVAGSFQLILGLVNTLQLVLHLPIMSVVFPGNVISFFEILIPVVMFDLLEKVELVQQFFPDSADDAEKLQGIINQMSDIGYDSYNPILNLGTIALFLSLYLSKMTALLFIYPLYKITGRGGQLASTLLKQVFFSDLIIMFLEGYMEFLISSQLLFVSPEESVDRTPLLYTVAVACMVMSIGILPLTLIIILWTQDLKKIKEEGVMNYFGAFFEDFNGKDKYSLAFNLVFMIRRFTYVAVSSLLGHQPGLQIILLNYQNLLAQVYVGKINPLLTQQSNRLELFNDFTIVACTFSLIGFSDYQRDYETQYLFGWPFIGIIVANILFNLSLYALSAFKNIRRLYRRVKRTVGRQIKRLKKRYKKRRKGSLRSKNIKSLERQKSVEQSQEHEKTLEEVKQRETLVVYVKPNAKILAQTKVKAKTNTQRRHQSFLQTFKPNYQVTGELQALRKLYYERKQRDFFNPKITDPAPNLEPKSQSTTLIKPQFQTKHKKPNQLQDGEKGRNSDAFNMIKFNMFTDPQLSNILFNEPARASSKIEKPRFSQMKPKRQPEGPQRPMHFELDASDFEKLHEIKSKHLDR